MSKWSYSHILQCVFPVPLSLQTSPIPCIKGYARPCLRKICRFLLLKNEKVELNLGAEDFDHTYRQCYLIHRISYFAKSYFRNIIFPVIMYYVIFSNPVGDNVTIHICLEILQIVCQVR